jgi:hypothetical protein
LVVKLEFKRNSNSSAIRNRFASCLGHLGYRPSLSDAKVWFKAATKVHGEDDYEYLFVETEDILAIGVNPKARLTAFNKYFSLKLDSTHTPYDCLGIKIKKNGRKAWGQSRSQSVLNDANNLEEWIEPRGYKLPHKGATSMQPK